MTSYQNIWSLNNLSKDAIEGVVELIREEGFAIGDPELLKRYAKLFKRYTPFRFRSS